MMRQRTGRTPPGLDTRFGNTVGPGVANPEMIGQLPASVFVGREMTHTSPPAIGHMTTSFGAQAGHTSQQAYTEDGRQDTLVQQKLAAHAGVHTPVTTVPVTISDASFATPTSIWSPTSNQNQQNFVTHNPNDASLWSQPSLTGDISSRSLPYNPPDSSVNPYADNIHGISTTAASQNPYASGGYGFTGHYDPNYPNALGLPMTHRGYPISPRSEASERASSLCPVTMVDNTSPPAQTQTSPSIGQSSGSRRDSISLTQDPPRNNYNQIYCDNIECAANPPIFSRKCEWS